VAAWTAPYLPLTRSAQDLSTFLSAVGTVTATLFFLSQGALPRRGWFLIGAIAAAGLGGLAWLGVQSLAAIVLVGTCLMALGHAIGHTVGSRIEHPGHLLPACVVAACVDLASVIHPSGPTHTVVASKKALDLLTISFPVLGTHAYAPSIGVGDIIFAALVLATAVRHRLSIRRMALLVATGLILAGLSSALLQQAVPALPAIGLCVVLGVPAARRLRSEDRRTAVLFMAGAIVLAAGVVISRFLPYIRRTLGEFLAPWSNDAGIWLVATLLSVGLFLGTLVAVPVLWIRLPADFLVREPGLRPRWKVALRTVAAVLLIAMGAAMLLLPGQGLLTILIGVSLLDFPAKRALQRRLLQRPAVLRTINRLRRSAGRDPLQSDLPGT